MNCYIPTKGPKKYKWYDHDLMLYIDVLKCEHFVKNMENHVARAKIVNLHLIHHECRGDKLSYPKYFYEKIENNDFQNYESEVKAEAVASRRKIRKKKC